MSHVRNIQIRGLSDCPIALPPFLDEIPIGIVVFNSERRVILINRAIEALTGFFCHEAYGIPCHYVLRSNLCIQDCQMKLAHERSEPITGEANIINRNRQKIPVRLTTGPIFDSKGNVAAYIKSVEDLRSCDASNNEFAKSFLFGKMVGRSQEMHRVFRVIPAIAQTDSSILITGETGTGKDFVAEAIHKASIRSKGPFVKVNCGALPESLLESELFGYQKGAFTGAVENKPGRFRVAHNGSLYLTEIGDLPLNLQVKLLSFLDDKVIHPLGSTKGVQVDVRVITATHSNLEKMVREGRFRQDLLFRLNVVRLQLPPLRKRGDDVKMLIDHFLQIFSPRFKKKVPELGDGAKDILLDYPYPGNVRELRNIIEYAVNICEGDQIKPHHLPVYILEYEPSEEIPEMNQSGAPESPPIIEQPPSHREFSDANWTEAERKMILDAMVKAQGRRSDAAKILGWGRTTLWRKIKRYGILT